MRKNLQGKKVLALLLAAAMFLGNTDAVMAAGRGTAETAGQVTVVGQGSALTADGTVTEPGETDGTGAPEEGVTDPADGKTPGTEIADPAEDTDPADGKAPAEGETDPADETADPADGEAKPADGEDVPAEGVDPAASAEDEASAEEGEGLTVTTSDDAELLGAAVVTRPIHVYYVDLLEEGGGAIDPYKYDVDGQLVKDIYDEPEWDEDSTSELEVDEDTLEKDTGYNTLAEARKAIWEDRTNQDNDDPEDEQVLAARLYRIELVKTQAYVIGETDLDFEYYSGDEAKYKVPPESEQIVQGTADPDWKLWKQVSLKTNGNRLSVDAEKWVYVKLHRIGTGVEKKTTTLTIAKNAYDYGHLIFGTMTQEPANPADPDHLAVHVPADLIVNGSGDVVIRPDAECKGAITAERIRTSVDVGVDGIPTGPEVAGKLTATGELILSAGTTVKDVVSKKRTVIGGVYAAGSDPDPEDDTVQGYADAIYANSTGLADEGNNFITFSGTLDLGGEIVSNFYMYDPDNTTPDDEVFYSPILHYHFIDEHPDPAINLAGTLKAQYVTDFDTGKADAVYDGPFLRFSKQHSTVADDDHEFITNTNLDVKFETHDVLGKLTGAATAVNDKGTTVAITKDNIDEWIDPVDRALDEGCAILDGAVIKVGVYHYQLFERAENAAVNDPYRFRKGFHTLAAMSDYINRDENTDHTQWRVGFEKDEDLGTIANLPDKGADLRLLGKGDRVRLKLTGTTTLKTNMTLENIILEVNGDLNSKKKLTLSGGTDTSTDPATALDVKGNIRFTDGELTLGEADVNNQKPVTVYSTGAVELKDLTSNLKGNRIFFPGTAASTRMKITGTLKADDGATDIELEAAPDAVAPNDDDRNIEGDGTAGIVEEYAVQLVLTGCLRKTTDKPIPKEFYDYSTLADAFLTAATATEDEVEAGLVVTNGFNGTEDPNKVRAGEQLFYWLLDAAPVGGTTYRIKRNLGAGIRLFSLGTGEGGTDVEIIDTTKEGNPVRFLTYKQVIDCIEKQRKPTVSYEIRLGADVVDDPLADGAILPPVEKTLAGTIKKYSALPIPNSCKGVTIRGPQGDPKRLVYEGNLDIKGKTVVFDNVILSPMTGKVNVAGSAINLGAGSLTLIDSRFNFADEYKRFSRIQGGGASVFTLTSTQPVNAADRIMLYVTAGITGVGSFTIERYNLTVGSGVGEHSPMTVGNLTATESDILVKTLTANGAQGVRLDDASVVADQNAASAAITISKNLTMRNDSEVRARTGAVTVSGQTTLGVFGEPGVAPSLIYAGTNVTLGSLVVNSTGNKIDLGEANGAAAAKLTITGTATVTSRATVGIALDDLVLADSKYKAYRELADPGDDADTERYVDAVLFKHGQYCTQKETSDGHGHSTTTYAYDELPGGIIATAKNVVDPRIFVAVEAYEADEADMIYRIVKKSGGNLVLRSGIPGGVVLWSDATGKAEYEDMATGAWSNLGEFDSLAEALVNITERNVRTNAYCVEIKEEIRNTRNELVWSATPVVDGIFPAIALPSALKRLIIAGNNDPDAPTTVHFTGAMKQGSAMELRNLILESDQQGTITAGAYDLRIVDCVSKKDRGLCNISAATAKNVSVEGGDNGKFEISGSFQIPAGTLTLRNQEVYAKYGVTAKNLTLGDEEDGAYSVSLKVEGVSNITATTAMYNGAEFRHTGTGAVTFNNIENHADNAQAAASNAISYALSGISGLSINGRVRKYALDGGAVVDDVPEIRLLFPVSNGSDYIWKYFPLQPKKEGDDEQQPRGMVAPETYLAKMPLAKTGDFEIRLGDDVTDDGNIVNQDLTVGEEFAAKANGALYVVQEIHSNGNAHEYGWRNNLVMLWEFDEDGEVPATCGNYIDLSQAVAQIDLAGGLNRSFRILVGFGKQINPGTDVEGDPTRKAFNAETGQKDGTIPVRKVLDTNVLDEQPHGMLNMPGRNKACSVTVAAYPWEKNDQDDPDPMAILEFSGDVTAYGGGVLNDRRKTNVDGGIGFSNLILKPVNAENAENGAEIPATVNLRLYRSDGARYAKPMLSFFQSVVSHAGGGIRQIQGTPGATQVWVNVYTPGDDPDEYDVRQEVRILGGFTGIDRVTVVKGLLMTGGTSACDTLRLFGPKAEYAALGATTVGKLLVDPAARGTAVLTTKNDKSKVFTLTGYAMTPDEKYALPVRSVAVRTAVGTQTAEGPLVVTKANGAKEIRHNDLIYADQPVEDGGEDLEYHKSQAILLRALKAEALIFIAERILDPDYCDDHWITSENVIAYKDADNYVRNANKNDMAVYITGGDPEVAIYAATWWDAVTLADLLPRDKEQKLVFDLLQAVEQKENNGNFKRTQRYTTTGRDGGIGPLVFPKYAKKLVIRTATGALRPQTMVDGTTAALVFSGQIKATCPVEFKDVQLYETTLTDAKDLIKKDWGLEFAGFKETKEAYEIARDDGVSLDAGGFDVSFEDTTTIDVVKGKKDTTIPAIPTAANGIYPWYAGMQDVLAYDPDAVAGRVPMQFYGITGAAGKIKFTGRDVFLRSGNLTAQNLILEQSGLQERLQVTLGNGLVDVKNLTVKGSVALDNHARRPWTWAVDETYSKNDALRSKKAVNNPQAMKLGTVIGDEAALVNSLTLDYNFSKAQYKSAATMLTITETADRITNLLLDPWLFDSERTGDYIPMGAAEIVDYNTYAWAPKAWQKIAAMPKIFTSGTTFRFWSPADAGWLSIEGRQIGDPQGPASLYKYNQGLYMTSKQPVVRVFNTDGLYDTQFMSWDAAVKEIDTLARKVPNPDPKLARDHKNDIWDSYTMELLDDIGDPWKEEISVATLAFPTKATEVLLIGEGGDVDHLDGGAEKNIFFTGNRVTVNTKLTVGKGVGLFCVKWDAKDKRYVDNSYSFTIGKGMKLSLYQLTQSVIKYNSVPFGRFGRVKNPTTKEMDVTDYTYIPTVTGAADSTFIYTPAQGEDKVQFDTVSGVADVQLMTGATYTVARSLTGIGKLFVDDQTTLNILAGNTTMKRLLLTHANFDGEHPVYTEDDVEAHVHQFTGNFTTTEGAVIANGSSLLLDKGLATLAGKDPKGYDLWIHNGTVEAGNITLTGTADLENAGLYADMNPAAGQGVLRIANIITIGGANDFVAKVNRAGASQITISGAVMGKKVLNAGVEELHSAPVDAITITLLAWDSDNNPDTENQPTEVDPANPTNLNTPPVNKDFILASARLADTSHFTSWTGDDIYKQSANFVLKPNYADPVPFVVRLTCDDPIFGGSSQYATWALAVADVDAFSRYKENDKTKGWAEYKLTLLEDDVNGGYKTVRTGQQPFALALPTPTKAGKFTVTGGKNLWLSGVLTLRCNVTMTDLTLVPITGIKFVAPAVNVGNFIWETDPTLLVANATDPDQGPVVLGRNPAAGLDLHFGAVSGAAKGSWVINGDAWRVNAVNGMGELKLVGSSTLQVNTALRTTVLTSNAAGTEENPEKVNVSAGGLVTLTTLRLDGPGAIEVKRNTATKTITKFVYGFDKNRNKAKDIPVKDIVWK